MSSPAAAWHIDNAMMRRWVDGTASPLVSLSVEQHLQQCAQCRADVGACTPVAELDAIWATVLAEIEVGPVDRRQQVLCWMGLRPSDARLILGAVSLRAAWLWAVVGVLAFSVLAATLGASQAVPLFLAFAPLVPVAGVAAAYGPTVDPSYEIGLAAPYSMTRLVLLRTCAVLVTSVPVVVVAGLFLPTSAIFAVAWLLPALGFVVLVLALSNVAVPEVAATVIAAVWVVVVAFATWHGNPDAVFAPVALAAYLLLVGVAGVVFVHRLLGSAPAWRVP